ncbi:glycosyltransferase family 39 protein [candidate division TA06 bacterium]|nr:glycosyltransferase family 39 protein [candidate division TA06 bacterium]
MRERLWENIKSFKFAPEMLLAGIALLVMIPSLGIGPISDDFSWLQLAKQGYSQSIGQYLSQPAPFGYFRPLPMLFFKTAWQIFGPALWLYRLTALLLHALTVILIYRLARLFSFSGRVSLISSVIFALMPCHAEALLWLCSVNELFSAFFILAGIYLFFSRPYWRGVLISSVFFLLALLSRESAFCFIPLLLMLSLPRIMGIWRRLALAITAPTFLYVVFRALWLGGLPDSYLPPAPGRMDLNLLGMSIRLAQYLIKILLPVKSLMELFAFRPYVWFREIYSFPQMHPVAFWATSISALLIILFSFYGVVKTSGRQIVWPFLFSALALSVYLPFYNTGERFLYLPSAGVAVGLSLWIAKIIGNKRNLGLSLLALTLMIYGISFGNRIYRWHRVGDVTAQALARLDQRTEMLAPGSQVYLTDMPGLVFGIPCFSYYTFNHAWEYTFPGRKVEYYFDPAPKPKKIGAAFSFSLKELDFSPLP